MIYNIPLQSRQTTPSIMMSQPHSPKQQMKRRAKMIRGNQDEQLKWFWLQQLCKKVGWQSEYECVLQPELQQPLKADIFDLLIKTIINYMNLSFKKLLILPKKSMIIFYSRNKDKFWETLLWASSLTIVWRMEKNVTLVKYFCLENFIIKYLILYWHE